MIRQNARQVDTYAFRLAVGERHHNIECVATTMSSHIDVLRYVETCQKLVKMSGFSVAVIIDTYVDVAANQYRTGESN